MLFGRRLPARSHWKNISACTKQMIPLRQTSTISSGKVLVNGVNLYFEQSGSSDDVLLCMPGGLGSTQTDFGQQLRELSRDFTVIAFDPRGYGKSIPPIRDLPVDFLARDAADAAELMKTIGFSKYSILGWSNGGNSAIILAANSPECVQSLVVWGTMAYVTTEDFKRYDDASDISTWNSKMRDPLEALYGAEYLQKMWTDLCKLLELKIIPERGGNVTVEYLPKIVCPTLIVHGEKDPFVWRHHPEFLHKNITGSRLHFMSEGRHNLHLQYSDEFNTLVTGFLKQHFPKPSL